MRRMKKVASVFAMLCFSAHVTMMPATWAKETKGKESDKKIVAYDHPEYGSVSMEYYTYQDTELGLPLSYLKGKITLKDLKYHAGVNCKQVEYL